MHGACLCIFTYSSNQTSLLYLSAHPSALGRMATQPSVALATRPFLGWQDGAASQILLIVLDALSQIQAARQIYRAYLQNLCYLGGTNNLEILQIGPMEVFFHAEERRKLIHISAELQ